MDIFQIKFIAVSEDLKQSVSLLWIYSDLKGMAYLEIHHVIDTEYAV